MYDIDNINPTGKWKLQLNDMTWNVLFSKHTANWFRIATQTFFCFEKDK